MKKDERIGEENAALDPMKIMTSDQAWMQKKKQVLNADIKESPDDGKGGTRVTRQ